MWKAFPTRQKYQQDISGNVPKWSLPTKMLIKRWSLQNAPPVTPLTSLTQVMGNSGHIWRPLAGHIFVHGEDIVPKWRGLVAGSMVEFILYFDGQNLSINFLCQNILWVFWKRYPSKPGMRWCKSCNQLVLRSVFFVNFWLLHVYVFHVFSNVWISTFLFPFVQSQRDMANLKHTLFTNFKLKSWEDWNQKVPQKIASEKHKS